MNQLKKSKSLLSLKMQYKFTLLILFLLVSYVEKLPFPVRVKEHAMITKVVKKSGKKSKEHNEQLKVQPSIALVTDLTGKL